ncbi:glycosyltransferase family 4 protein [Neolewinella litorea]|uniref:Glycosyltransferase family 1 protein n=1 Tax=Neolewinella litorea TaxID=2562452 RepID=A0A4S4NHU0_9BACT|nr:glycosyltransferase family 4 protein [Neolewinella litorea]THH39276.1 glycosyltransferase family 1 protein [Neolewinella litorea]
MKILLSTPVFKPMVGGIETLALNTARHLTDRGHEVVVVTPITSEVSDNEPFRVVRQAAPGELLDLVRWSDLVFCNGASLYIAPYTLLVRRPVVMRHDGYQVSCIDGAGWYAGGPAPLRPLPSFWYHLKRGNPFFALRGLLKVTALRLYANHVVRANVAISDWMKDRHPLSNHVRIHNPFPISKFAGARNTDGSYDYDFFFLGRLISEKGVAVLIDAFIRLQGRTGNAYRLCIIGDGPERNHLEGRVTAAGLDAYVHFAGMTTGSDLIDLLRRCRIAVLPSTWEEPFGGVATELMAAGKNLIVSRDGALSELVADAGLAVPNSDAEALSEAMYQLASDKNLQTQHLKRAETILSRFDEERLIDAYENLFLRVHNNQSIYPIKSI